MSFQSAVAGLPSPAKELVLKATNDGADATLLGENEADQKSVNNWIEKTAKGEVGKADGLHASLFLCQNASKPDLYSRIWTKSSCPKPISRPTT